MKKPFKCEVCGTGTPHEPCEDCGQIVHVGEWYACPHGYPGKTKGFEAFFDYGLGKMVTTIGDINAACRPHWENDQYVHIQPRDKSASYYRELNERREARRMGR